MNKPLTENINDSRDILSGYLHLSPAAIEEIKNLSMMGNGRQSGFLIRTSKATNTLASPCQETPSKLTEQTGAFEAAQG